VNTKIFCALEVLVLATVSVSKADTIIWGNNYGGGGVQEYDANTGTSLGVIDTTEMQNGNGRGVVVVGNIMYYTEADSGSVYAYNLATATDLGIAFTVSGATGLATMAYDGKDLYIGDYSGTNNVYKYDLSGHLVQTIPLSKCSSFCDGLEYASGDLISNEFDGGVGGANTYDKYDLNGNLLKAGFIVTADYGGETGIAFDGKDYWVSEIFNHKLAEYDINGNFVQEVTLNGFVGNGFEDLSANYQVVLNPTPEPSSLSSIALLGVFSVVGNGLWRRIKRN
jgi:hypothetical protein